MIDSAVRHTYYEGMKGFIDPTCFVVSGFFGLEKLRSLEWINGPMTHQAMALAGAVNGLTIFLAERICQSGKSHSPYYKAMITVVGLTAGAIVTPYALSKVLKSHAVLITPEMSFRIAAFNLVAKIIICVAFTKGEQYYKKWNLPPFQDFEEMTEQTVRILYDHFKERADLWKKESFKNQLGFNQALQKYGLELLTITEIDLETSLTKDELATFRKLYEKGELTPEQATLLYNFHVPPQENRVYKAENLPIIDPRNVKVDTLSDEQIQWHHEWIICHPSEVLHQSQISAFVSHFYRLNLLPPSPSFVTELPFPKELEGLSSVKVSYLAHYYLQNPHKWSSLSLRDQIALKKAFAKHGLKSHPLREPTVEELSLPFDEKKHLKELKKHFKEDPSAWAIKSPTYQAAFNVVLSNHGMKKLDIPEQPWSTTKKVAVYVGVTLLIIGAVAGFTWIGLAYRASQINPTPDQDGNDIDPETCIGDETCPTYSGPMTAHQYTAIQSELPPHVDDGSQCLLSRVDQVNTCFNQVFNNSSTASRSKDVITGENLDRVFQALDESYGDVGSKELGLAKVSLDENPLPHRIVVQKQVDYTNRTVMCAPGFFDTGGECSPTPPKFSHKFTRIEDLDRTDFGKTVEASSTLIQIPTAASLEEPPLYQQKVQESYNRFIQSGDPILREVHQQFVAQQEAKRKHDQLSGTAVTIYRDYMIPGGVGSTSRQDVMTSLAGSPLSGRNVVQKHIESPVAMCKTGFNDTGLTCSPLKTGNKSLDGLDLVSMQLETSHRFTRTEDLGKDFGVLIQETPELLVEESKHETSQFHWSMMLGSIGGMAGVFALVKFFRKRVKELQEELEQARNDHVAALKRLKESHRVELKRLADEHLNELRGILERTGSILIDSPSSEGEELDEASRLKELTVEKMETLFQENEHLRLEIEKFEEILRSQLGEELEGDISKKMETLLWSFQQEKKRLNEHYQKELDRLAHMHETQIQVWESELKEFASEIDRLRGRVSELTSAQLRDRLRLQELEAIKSENEEKLKRALQTIENNKKTISKLRATVSKLKKELEEKNDQLSSDSAVILKRNKTIKKLISEISTKNKKIQELEGRVSEYQSYLTALYTELNKDRQVILKLKEEFRASQEELEVLKEELKVRKEDLMRYKNFYDNLVQKVRSPEKSSDYKLRSRVLNLAAVEKLDLSVNDERRAKEKSEDSKRDLKVLEGKLKDFEGKLMASIKGFDNLEEFEGSEEMLKVDLEMLDAYCQSYKAYKEKFEAYKEKFEISEEEIEKLRLQLVTIRELIDEFERNIEKASKGEAVRPEVSDEIDESGSGKGKSFTPEIEPRRTNQGSGKKKFEAINKGLEELEGQFIGLETELSDFADRALIVRKDRAG